MLQFILTLVGFSPNVGRSALDLGSERSGQWEAEGTEWGLAEPRASSGALGCVGWCVVLPTPLSCNPFSVAPGKPQWLSFSGNRLTGWWKHGKHHFMCSICFSLPQVELPTTARSWIRKKTQRENVVNSTEPIENKCQLTTHMATVYGSDKSFWVGHALSFVWVSPPKKSQTLLLYDHGKKHCIWYQGLKN